MFTGIIQSIGLIKKIESFKKDVQISIVYDPKKINGIKLGDSISVNGICLTVQKKTKKSIYISRV